MRRPLFLLLALTTLNWLAAPIHVFAVPVTYEVSLGSFTSFYLTDQNGDTTDCEIGAGSSSCLDQSVDVTGSIVFDDQTGQILSMVYELSGTAIVDFSSDNWNDIQQLQFYGLNYQSAGPSVSTLYGLKWISGGQLTSTIAVTDSSGNVSVTPDHEFDGIDGVATFVAIDSSGGITLDIIGAQLGVLCDPNSPTDCGNVATNFNLTGSVAALSVAFTTSHGTTTNLPSIALTGIVNQSGTSVDVEGVAATVTDMTWSATVPLSPGSNGISATATLGAETAIDEITIVQVVNPPPPAPALPPLDPVEGAVPTTVADATAFLYSGLDPVQTGVTPGTILASRAGVIRGRVLDGSGFPLESVTVTVVDHPEFGQTLSRADGQYDLAVNAGGALSLEYVRDGLITVFRTSRPEWRDFDVLDDVVLLPRSPLVTAVDTSGAAAFTVVQGALESDALHTRQATLLIPKDTIATAVLSGGGTTSLGTSFAVRVTELTVGPLAVNALPAEMPIGGDPTNVWDVVLDEAIALGSEHVEFDKPISFYVETTAAFSVGDEAPSISFDSEQGIWLDNPTGVVLEILSETGGIADLDTDGDGFADNSATLLAHGITLDEQTELANLYAPGATLRRYPTTRFSAMCGHSIAFPLDATAPGQGRPDPHGCDTCKQPGNNSTSSSMIRTGRQVWAEQVDLTGSPYNLHYESDRVPGYQAANTIRIPLTDATPPAPLQGVNLEVEIAGRKFAYDFPPLSNLSHTFVWDGLDAYGRVLQGRQPVRIRIAYQYQGFTDGRRTPVYKFQRMKFRLGPFDARGVGMGGWTLSPHHVYDPLSEVLYRGDGERRTGGELPAIVINRAGITQGLPSNPGATKPSERSFQFLASALGAGPDGMFYIAEDFGFPKVHQVDPAADTITEIGTLPSSALVGDIAIGPDGAIYTSSSGRHAIYRMDLTGAVTVFAGQEGTSGFSGDAGPAAASQLSFPASLDFGPDGSLYIADQGNYRIRRVKPDGTIETFAGDGVFGSPSGIPGDAKAARLGTIQTLEVNDDGEVFVGEVGNRVYRINDTGYIEVFAGTGSSQANLPDPSGIGDGGPAAAANMGRPRDIAIGSDGSVYIATGGGSAAAFRLRRVRPDGIIETVFGTGTNSVISGANTGSGKIARRVDSLPTATDVLPDGTLLVLDLTIPSRSLVWSVEPPLPGFSLGNYLVASRDGRELYIFDSSGAHLETRDVLMEAQQLTFQYTAEGTLDKIIDADDNETTIVRDSNGIVTGIQPPFGPATDLTLDANGYLATISNPLNETHTITSSADGMIALFAKPGGNATTTLTYDPAGRLILDEDPEGGFFAITRTEMVNELTVTTSSATGVSKSTVLRREVNGDLANERVREDGLISTFVEAPDGAITVNSPDGMSVTRATGPDPRLSMAAPIPELLEITTPGMLRFKREQTREIETDAVTGLLTRQTDTITLNDRLSSTIVEYLTDTDPLTPAAATLTTTTEEGRMLFDDLDDRGRLIATQVNGLEPVSVGYDTAGRLDTLTQGAGASERQVMFAYDADGNLESVTDPLMRAVSFEYDAAGRVTKQILPDLREVNFTYDVRGNLSTLTPPGQPAHVFLYTGLDQEEEYAPPALPLVSSPSTTFLYNLDKQLVSVARPDGKDVTLSYEDPLLGRMGRLESIDIPRGTITQSFDPTTGNLGSILAPGGEGLAFGYDGSLVTSTTWSGTVAGTVDQTYDDDFRIDSQTVDGSTVMFGYDDDGLLTSAGAMTLTRDPLNGLLTDTLLGAVDTAQTFNTFGELETDDAQVSASSIYANTYVRDNLGRITQKTETIQGTTTVYDYHYEDVGRLKQVDENGFVARVYTYDSNGNRLSVTEGAVVTSGTYDAQDRMETYGTKTYTYSAGGDLEKVEDSAAPQGDLDTFYTYDALGNLIQVDLPDGREIKYVIDGQNRRVGNKVDGILVQGWLYQDQLNPVAELDGAGNVVARFVYGSRPNVPDYMVKGGTTYRILSDHLGSPRLVINESSGIVAQRLDYDEFGRVTQDSSVGFQPFGFAGGIHDADTELVRFGARDYHAEIGRWTVRDPIRFESIGTNLYGYSLGNPVNLVDPAGLDPTSPTLVGPPERPTATNPSNQLIPEGPMISIQPTHGLPGDPPASAPSPPEPANACDPTGPPDCSQAAVSGCIADCISFTTKQGGGAAAFSVSKCRFDCLDPCMN